MDGSHWKLFNGCFEDNTHRWVKDKKEEADFQQELYKKKTERGYFEVLVGDLPLLQRGTASVYLQKIIEVVELGLAARGKPGKFEILKASIGANAAEQVQKFLLTCGVSASIV